MMPAFTSRVVRGVACRRIGVQSRQFAAISVNTGGCPFGFGGHSTPEMPELPERDQFDPSYPEDLRNPSEIRGIERNPIKAFLTGGFNFVDEAGKKRSLMDPTSNVHFFRFLYREHAREDNISVMPMPGVGDVLVVHDPSEFMKVIRNEGQYPHGGIALSWSFKSYMRREQSKVQGLLGSDHEWRSYRNIIQKDLLSPSAARGYMPAIARACEYSSEMMEKNADQINVWSAWASFDIFCSVFFGRFFKTSAMDETSDQRGLSICHGMEKSSETMWKMMMNPLEPLADKFDIVTPNARQMSEGFTLARTHGKTMVEEFMEREAAGKLDKYEKKSYLYGMIQRQKAGTVSVDETVELCTLLLSAAVDTTSSVINWNLVNLALNQDVQEKLLDELQTTLKGEDLDEKTISSGKGWLPYLHAVSRETHRMTPTMVTSIIRRVPKEIDVCGYQFEKDSWFMLDGYSVQNEPNLVVDCKEFKPERWLPKAVAERKGTPSEIIDHPLIRAPFSAGARMCPGSRVANLEVMGLLARIVQDYKIEAVDVSSIEEVPGFQGVTIQPQNMPKLKLTKRNSIPESHI